MKVDPHTRLSDTTDVVKDVIKNEDRMLEQNIKEDMHTVTPPRWKENKGVAEHNLKHCLRPFCAFQQTLQEHL